MATHSQSKEAALADRKWLVVDAADMPVGRVASQVAALLRGKHKVTYTRHVDTGDFVVVLNAEKARFTGRKADQKVYHFYSGYIGGDKQVVAGKMMEKNPSRVIEMAVQGMLPKGPLGRDMLKKLKVYTGTEHPHAAQRPEAITLKK